MKHLILTLIFFLASFAAHAKNKTIERPPFTGRNTTTLEIDKIVLSDTATVFYIQAYYRPKNWIKIDAGTYLQSGDEQFLVRHADGIDLNQEFWMPDSGEASFKLVFPPLPQGTQSVDFIESDCADCFKIWGIRIDGRDLDPLAPGLIPEKSVTGTEAPAETPSIEKGYAVLKGKLLEYQPAMKFQGNLYANDLISGRSIEIPFTVNDDGTFRAQMLLYAPTKVTLWSPFFQGDLIMAPNRETEAFFCLREIARKQSKLRHDAPSYGQCVYFKGAYAALNDDLANRPLRIRLTPSSEQEYYGILDDIKDMQPAQFKEYWLDRYRQAVARIEAMPETGASYKKLCSDELAMQIVSQLLMPVPMLQSAYRRAYPEAKGPGPQYMDSLSGEYYDFLKTLNVTDPHWIVCGNYSRLPNLIRTVPLGMRPKKNPAEMFEYLLASGTLSEEEAGSLRELMDSIKANRAFNSQKLSAIFANHPSTVEAYRKETIKKQYDKKALQQFLGKNDALLFDLIDIQPLGQQIAEYEPLTQEQTGLIEQMQPAYRDILYSMNNDLLRKIEENKKKTGYTEYETPQVPDDRLFETLIAPYKGKVIFIDFWATWCRPCRQAMSEAEPVKSALAGKGIVYLYLTGETSPLGTWKNTIPDIPGEHYRLSEQQWNYISRQFGVSAIPSYLIVDRQGKQVLFRRGFMGADKMKQILTDELDK